MYRVYLVTIYTGDIMILNMELPLGRQDIQEYFGLAVNYSLIIAFKFKKYFHIDHHY